MSEQEHAGFEIRGRFYPMPEAFRICDPVLVEELTGLAFNDFAERLDEMGAASRNGGESEVDAVLLPGLIGVAIWQMEKRWPRAKVVKFVQQVGIEEVEMHAGTDDAADGEPRPPGEGSSTSSPTSTTPPAEEQEPEE